jgi:uncharacterized GH25 family protein
MLSESEKKKRQHEKELKSFRKKMVNNIVWFDSLDKKRQFDLLFRWKRSKYRDKINVLNHPKVEYIRKLLPSVPGGRLKLQYKMVKSITYPEKLKYFIEKSKRNYRYQISKSTYRNTAIDILLKNK